MGAFWGPLYKETTEPHQTPEVTALDVSEISKRFSFLPVGPIVDLGCGHGRHLAGVCATTGREVIGVEFDTESIEEAQKSGCKVIQADFANLPFEDAAIAGVYSWSNTLYSIHPWLRKKTLVECARIMPHGGVLVFQSMSPEIASKMKEKAYSDQENGLVVEDLHFVPVTGRLKIKRWFKRKSDGKILVGNCDLYCPTEQQLLNELDSFDFKVRDINYEGIMRIITAERMDSPS